MHVFVSVVEVSIYGSTMSSMDEENTKSANKQHWDNFKLISKSVSSSASMKTKNVIIEANIDSSKITHQKLSSLTNLTKKQKRI